jgi:hypothetical protein
MIKRKLSIARHPFTRFGWNTFPRTRRHIAQFKWPTLTPSRVAMRILLRM